MKGSIMLIAAVTFAGISACSTQSVTPAPTPTVTATPTPNQTVATTADTCRSIRNTLVFEDPENETNPSKLAALRSEANRADAAMRVQIRAYVDAVGAAAAPDPTDKYSGLNAQLARVDALTALNASCEAAGIPLLK